MKSLNKLLIFLLGSSLLLSTACSKNASSGGVTLGNQEDASSIADTVPAENIPVNETKPDGTCDIHVTIQNVEVSVKELKENNYVVPVYVELDQNAGITYAEWGAEYDSKCTLEYDAFDENVRFNTICSINKENHFFWTAWAASENNDHTGNLILLNVTLPKDASAGDTFPIKYASFSHGGKAHVWNNNEKDWVTDGVIGWTDGGVTVIN